ncbi:MAG: flavodoxin domain-containing protein [Pseudomonadota bacterium]
MRILIIYSTIEGQTRKIAKQVSQHLRTGGHVVDLVDAAAPPASLSIDNMHAVICAGPLHAGHFPPPLRRYVKDHQRELMARPGLFLSVSLTALEEEDAERAVLDELVGTFSDETDWWPISVHHAAGALKYSEYDYFRKWMLKRIVKSKGIETTTDNDYEFTDWESVFETVDQFVRDAPATSGKF